MCSSKQQLFHIFALIFLLSSCSSPDQGSKVSDKVELQSTLVVDAGNTIAEIQPTMWGIFYEDINFAGDGGLYAEMVKNRSFEFFNPMMGWRQHESDRHSMNRESGRAVAINTGEESNARFARVEINSEFRLTNEGFRGMGVKQDNKYNFSTLARQIEGTTTMKIELVDSVGNVLGSSLVQPSGKEWKTYETTLTSSKTDAKAQLSIKFDGVGIVDLDMVSLFPEDTWMGRPKGLRKDLVELLDGLEPGFLRFPGGCIVEGRELATRYQWKKTVGPIEDRTMMVNRWNTEFRHRPAPDYFQTFGLGFFEYFQLSEDIGAEPLPILSCGMACQFNTAELVPMDQLDPYVQDALDLIEFANGAVTSTWGKVRASMGHPEPFNLKMIGVGNEQWGEAYIERYKVFEKAIKAKYPEIIIVSGTGPFPDGEHFEYAMGELKELDAEIIDEHYYRPPQWFLDNANRYDDYDREGPKIFAGEYAAQSVAIASPDNKNNWECAVSEAAFMTGLERNADIVHLTSYAPLFAHAEGWQWTPDMIWFDNLNAYATPNYYVQKLFSTNSGTHLLPLTEDGKPVSGKDGLYASAVKDENTGELIIKVVNASDGTHEIEVKTGTVLAGKAIKMVLTAVTKDAVNSFEDPQNVSPQEQSINTSGEGLTTSLDPWSLNVIRVKMQ